VPLDNFPKHDITVGTQNELPLEALQHLQQGVEIPLAIAAVMPLIRSYIRRIAIEKCLRRVPAPDYLQGVVTLDLNRPKPNGIIGSEVGP
jgi:hypothetical protein